MREQLMHSFESCIGQDQGSASCSCTQPETERDCN